MINPCVREKESEEINPFPTVTENDTCHMKHRQV